MAHGAGPAGDEIRAARLAALKDAQERDELILGEALAAAFSGHIGEGIGGVIAADEGAMAGLHTPDGDQHLAVDAIGRLDRRERRREVGHLLAPGIDPCLAHRHAQVVPYGLGKFGLFAGRSLGLDFRTEP